LTKAEAEQRKAAREARREARQGEAQRKQGELMRVYGGLRLRGRTRQTLTFVCPYCGTMLIDWKSNQNQFTRNVQGHIGNKHMDHLLKQDLKGLPGVIDKLVNPGEYEDNQEGGDF